MDSEETTRSLLLANLLTAGLALMLRWPLETLLWPYWCQSVIIGWFARRRMLALKQFSTGGFRINGAPVPETPESLAKTAAFFTMHFGAFHLAYFAFLATRSATLGWWDVGGIFVAAGLFVVSQNKSFRATVAADNRARPNLGALMFLPYLRVIPMHLTILAGSAASGGNRFLMLVFVALKTGADVLMHSVETRIAQAGVVRLKENIEGGREV